MNDIVKNIMVRGDGDVGGCDSDVSESGSGRWWSGSGRWCSDSDGGGREMVREVVMMWEVVTAVYLKAGVVSGTVRSIKLRWMRKDGEGMGIMMLDECEERWW